MRTEDQNVGVGLTHSGRDAIAGVSKTNSLAQTARSRGMVLYQEDTRQLTEKKLHKPFLIKSWANWQKPLPSKGKKAFKIIWT
ncbi:MAG: hypothetical protein AB1861_12725 [Cyanobacteriota bacterium]